MRFTKFIVVIFLFLAAIPAAVPAAEPLGKRIQLDNGMVLLLAEKHDIPMVTVSMAIKAGNTAAAGDKPGLAAITAALLTQGTTRRTANQISSDIDFIGGSLSTRGGDDFAVGRLSGLQKDKRTGCGHV